jgi:hypothetical protein
VINAGAWVGALLPGSQLPFRIERQAVHWFEPVGDAQAFAPAKCPIHLWQFDGDRYFYGFPDLGGGVKLACHHGGGDTVTVGDMSRDVAPAEVEHLRVAARRFGQPVFGPRLQVRAGDRRDRGRPRAACADAPRPQPVSLALTHARRALRVGVSRRATP